MLKVAILLAVIAFVACEPLVGGFSDAVVGPREQELARWSTNQLASLVNFDGDFTYLQLRKVRTQVVAGINYELTFDVLSRTSQNKYGAKTCTVVINERAWENVKEIIRSSCVENTTIFGKQPEY